MSTPETSLKPVAKANKARNAAIRRLMSSHSDEYITILAEERVSLGLSPSGAGSRSKRGVAERNIKKLKEMGLDTAELEKQLETQTW